MIMVTYHWTIVTNLLVIDTEQSNIAYIIEFIILIVKKQFNTVTLCDPLTNEIAERNVHLKNIVPYKLCEIETSGTRSPNSTGASWYGTI